MSGLEYCRIVHTKLMNRKHKKIAEPFYYPVDPVALALPDYFDIIKNPMDLGTIKTKLDEHKYKNWREFDGDMKLMFNNCYLYNPPGDPIVAVAKRLEEVYNQEMAFMANTETFEPEEQGVTIEEVMALDQDELRRQKLKLRKDIMSLSGTDLTLLVDLLRKCEPDQVEQDGDTIDLSLDEIKSQTFATLVAFIRTRKLEDKENEN